MKQTPIMLNNQTTHKFNFWFWVSIISILLIGGCRPPQEAASELEETESTAESSRTFWKVAGRIEIENNPSFTHVFQRAVRKRRPIFISYYAKWCETCPYMNEETVTQPPVSLYLENEFVSFLVDAETNEGNALAKEYQVVAYPTIIFLNSEGEEISRHIGLATEHKIMQLAKSAVIAEDKFQRTKELQRRK